MRLNDETNTGDHNGDRNIGYMRLLFSEADLDNSGTLSRSELARVLKQPKVSERLQRMGLMTNGASDTMLSYFFEECDQNGDGCIDLEEFEKGYIHIREILRHRLVEHERQIFDQQTQNGNSDMASTAKGTAR